MAPFEDSVPFYNLKVAAGVFSESDLEESDEWIKLPETYKVSKEHFVCRVHGNSMNKKIPDGSFCLFKKDTGGSREGKIVLVEHRNIQDSEFGAGYTVKLYHSEKVLGQDNWSHSFISLKPKSSNPEYSDIILQPNESIELKVIGIFECVVE